MNFFGKTGIHFSDHTFFRESLCGRSWVYREREISGDAGRQRTTRGHRCATRLWLHQPNREAELDEAHERHQHGPNTRDHGPYGSSAI